ncbi:MAG: c-type cytochrome [Acidobacteriota bacterium]|nr:c-type cytochrome [Acidobacteriota bacterium]MDE3265184.1 c-type cytochrome [Acidobacteriota bacterium]
MRWRVSPFIVLALCTAPLAAQRGDREGHVMEQVWRQFEVPEAPPLAPEEAMATLRVAPGFRIELVAAEPLVEDPVAMAWDEGGLLYVVEMRGFMPNVDGEGEQEPVGRVVVLEDTDADGAMDRGGVYLDGLVSPRAVATVTGGVLVGEPPNLWLCRSEAGSGELPRCASRERLLDYGDPDPDLLEHTENGLLWGLDNWIYNAKSDRRFRLRRDAEGASIEVDPTLFRGQWGITQDDVGRLYYNTNSRYLFADLIPADYALADPDHQPRGGGRGASERLVHDESVYSIRVNPGINRGYVNSMLREDGRLAVTTSVSGLAVYRGDQFPATFRGDVFVPEPAGNVVAHFDLAPGPAENGIPTLVAEHRRYGDPAWVEREFLASTDERFRPVDAKVGPDGALYVIDMYRGILQHVRYVTTYLREYILEHGLDRPLGMGRIYRVVWEGDAEDPASVRREAPRLATAAERIAALSHPNGWERDTAQRLLVENDLDDADRDALRELARSGENRLSRIHALWTLHGRGELDAATVQKALRARDPWLVVHALRTGEEVLAESATGEAAIADLLDSSSPQVRTQALLTVGAMARESTWARNVLAERVTAQPDDPFHRQVALAANLTGASDPPDAPAAAPAMTAPEAAQFNRGRRHYRACRSCHNNDGEGQEGLGPTLVNTPWVLGSPERLVALVLHGIEGPIEVHGETWDDLMPGFAADPRLPDDAIAALLTYIRRSWGNTADPVPPELVTNVRQRTSDRVDPWTAAELESAFP